MTAVSNQTAVSHTIDGAVFSVMANDYSGPVVELQRAGVNLDLQRAGEAQVWPTVADWLLSLYAGAGEKRSSTVQGKTYTGVVLNDGTVLEARRVTDKYRQKVACWSSVSAWVDAWPADAVAVNRTDRQKSLFRRFLFKYQKLD